MRSAILLILALWVGPVGCCGIGAGPSKEQMNARLSKMIGAPLAKVAAELKQEGFKESPAPGKFEKQTNMCLVFYDGMEVTVFQDRSGRLESYVIKTFTEAP